MDSINWKNPDIEIPKEGDVVVALEFHWKADYPSSMEIMGGSVEFSNDNSRWRVQTNDNSGKGNHSIDGEDIQAWCYADEFFPAFPSFLIIMSRTPKWT